MKTYTTKERAPRPIEFELDGETFHFTPPKQSRLIMDAVTAEDQDMAQFYATRDLFNWLGLGLSDEQGQRILDRLNDPADDLDTDTVMEITHDLIKEASNRPTKQPSD